MYRKAVLEEEDPHNLEFDEFQMEDYPTGLKGLSTDKCPILYF